MAFDLGYSDELFNTFSFFENFPLGLAGGCVKCEITCKDCKKGCYEGPDVIG